MRWTVHLQGGPQRVNHAAVAVGNRIYSFGGYCSNEGYTVTGKIDIHVLNIDTLRWSPVTYSSDNPQSVPFKRYGHTVVAYKQKIYLWGGRNDTHSSHILHCFDVDEARWTLPVVSGNIPRAADGHSACIIGNYMFVYGGFEEDIENFGQTVHRLNLVSMIWDDIRTTGTPPVSRDFHTASAIGSNMYIFGGRSNGPLQENGTQIEFYCDEIMFLDTVSMHWVNPQSTGTVPIGRRSHSAVVYKDELFIFGGYNALLSRHFGDMCKYSPGNNSWTQVQCFGEGPCPRRRHCCCVVGDMLYLFGGTSPNYVRRKSDQDIALEIHDHHKLLDHSDLFVLDFFSSLKRLCILQLIESRLVFPWLPNLIRREIFSMTTDNNISKQSDYPRRDFGHFATSA